MARHFYNEKAFVGQIDRNKNDLCNCPYKGIF